MWSHVESSYLANHIFRFMIDIKELLVFLKAYDKGYIYGGKGGDSKDFERGFPHNLPPNSSLIGTNNPLDLYFLVHTPRSQTRPSIRVFVHIISILIFNPIPYSPYSPNSLFVKLSRFFQSMTIFLVVFDSKPHDVAISLSRGMPNCNQLIYSKRSKWTVPTNSNSHLA